MNKNKNINYGFVIILSDRNRSYLQLTANSLKENFSGVPFLCVVDCDTPVDILKELNNICPTYVGRKTITSLINAGIKNNTTEWSIFLMGGVYFTTKKLKKLLVPINDRKDIIFSIMPDYDRSGKPIRLHATFPESSLNGFTVNNTTFSEIGEMTDHPWEMARTMWNWDAISNGCIFKGVLTQIRS